MSGARFLHVGAGLTGISHGDTIVIARHGTYCKPGLWAVTRVASVLTPQFFNVPNLEVADAVVDEFGDLVRVS